MAKKKHQFIVGLIIRQMREYGYTVLFVDGKYSFDLPGHINIPPKIIRHRPDVLGINECGRLCIGEAKTDNDIASNRTMSQIEDFTSIKINNMNCYLIIGIPSMAEEKFFKILRDLGLSENSNIHVLCVPEGIINE
jgi:hypothetical protein